MIPIVIGSASIMVDAIWQTSIGTMGTIESLLLSGDSFKNAGFRESVYISSSF